MKIYKAYRYLFYKLYKWSESLHGDEESHEYTAYLSLTLLIFVNMLTFFHLLMIMFNFSIESNPFNKFEIVVFAYLFALPHYFLLIYRNKYFNIISEFENENKKDNRRGTIYIWIYIIATFALFFGLVFIQMRINEAGALTLI